MIVRTHFRHLEIESDFEGIVRAAVTQKFGRLAHERDLVLEIFVAPAAPRTAEHGPVFECHMTLWSPSLHRKIFAKESGEDFWFTLSDCGEAVKVQLQKAISQRRALRRRERAGHFDLAV